MMRAFHVFVSLLLALPLGAGGMCCCVLGQADNAVVAAVEVSGAEPVRSCCSAEPVPSESGQSGPVGEGEEDCGCPVRDAALFAASSNGKFLPLPALADDLLAPQTERAFTYATDEPREGSRIPHPPSKKPLYRTLSVLLC